MKKVISLALIILLLFGVLGCEKKENTTVENGDDLALQEIKEIINNNSKRIENLTNENSKLKEQLSLLSEENKTLKETVQGLNSDNKYNELNKKIDNKYNELNSKIIDNTERISTASKPVNTLAGTTWSGKVNYISYIGGNSSTGNYGVVKQKPIKISFLNNSCWVDGASIACNDYVIGGTYGGAYIINDGRMFLSNGAGLSILYKSTTP